MEKRQRKKTKVLIPDMSGRKHINMPDGRRIYWFRLLQAHVDTRPDDLHPPEDYEQRRKIRKGFELMAQARYLYGRGYPPFQIDEMLKLKEGDAEDWLQKGGYHEHCEILRGYKGV